MTAPNGSHDRHLWQFRWVRDLIVLAVVVFVVWLGYRVSIVTIPLLVALTAAYLCEPLVSRLARHVPRIGRTGAAFVMLTSLVLILAALAALVLVPVTYQAVALVRDAPRLLAKAESYLTAEARPDWLREHLVPLLAPITAIADAADSSTDTEPDTNAAEDNTEQEPAAVEETPPVDGATDPDEKNAAEADAATNSTDTASPPALDPLSGVLSRIARIVGSTTETIFASILFITVVLFAFVPLSASFPAVARWLHELVPPAMRTKAEPLLQRMDQIISGFVRGRLITAGLLAVVYAVGWSLVGVPYAAVVGIITGIASLIPYAAALGLPVAWMLVATAAIGAGEAGFYVTEDDNSFNPIWWKILLFPAIVNVVAQVLEDYVLNPLIQGKAVHLHPLVILLAIIAGGSLMGLYGMILAVPVAACAKVMLDAVVAPALRHWAEHASRSEVDPPTNQ